MEDGRLTDSKGRTVDFKNCVLIMTSNIGSGSLDKRLRIGFEADTQESGYDSMKEKMLSELKKSFRPEFLNRVDDIIVFRKLSEENTRAIARLMLGSIIKRLDEKDIHLSYTEEAAELLAKEGFDAEYGARPLRRLMQQTVEDKLSEEILEGNIRFGDHVRAYVRDGVIAFKKDKAAAAKEVVTATV